MNRLEAFKTIAAQASRGELTFPTHVEASLKLQRALSDPGCHVDAAARLVQAEPLLAARTVAMANSAAFSQTLHMTLAAYAATGLGVAGIHAIMILRGKTAAFLLPG